MHQFNADKATDLTACPLCYNTDTAQLDQNKQRAFWSCSNCYLVFVPAHQHLSADEEKKIYDYHQNDITDSGYRKFLSRLASPLLERLPEHASGLDFGCGPGPALADILRKQGHEVALFDQYYEVRPEALTQQYDFITSTEVFEHLRNPRVTIGKLVEMLRPGGYLGVMTKLIPELERFCDWHYTRDLTHICFYEQRTFEYLAEQHGLNLEILRSDVILLQRT